MKKIFKKVLCVAVCISLLTGLMTNISAFYESADEWNSYFDNFVSDNDFEILLTVGADDTERNISWFSEKADVSSVLLSETEDFSESEAFTATSEETLEGDYINRAVISGLDAGKTYYYKCVSDDKQSEVGTFSTLDSKNFSALYVTDIHIGKEEISDTSYAINNVFAKAQGKADFDLILSTGDQASDGLRSEYQGLIASLDATSSGISIATAIGNHDRKGIAYRYFNNNPNQYEDAKSSSYIGKDYYFVKGDALFLVFDSNYGSMSDHRNFALNAARENPDVKWRIAMFHHDLFGDRKVGREAESKLLRFIWTPVLDEIKTDLVLLGHSHYYTISDVIFDNKAVAQTDDVSEVLNPKGTIYMVSGSINRPRTSEDGKVPPIGECVGHHYITEEPIYNILDFSENAIEIKSYTTENDEPFNTFKITKTSNEGGHPEDSGDWYDPIVRFISDIYGRIAEFFVTMDMLSKKNNFVGK